jgi:putative nucleotidyltransferase with HDIG domain
MSARLDLADAEALLVRHLGDTPRAAHSRIVAAIMAALAQRSGEDAELWRIVGLLHDIDYFAVAGEWSRHGVVAAEWLATRLPPEALDAIAAHDHRTGLEAEGLVADALRLADALAVFDQRAGRAAVLGAVGLDEWRVLAGERTFLYEMISEFGGRAGIGYDALRAIVGALPEQPPAS